MPFEVWPGRVLLLSRKPPLCHSAWYWHGGAPKPVSALNDGTPIRGVVRQPDGRPAAGILLRVEGRGATNHYCRMQTRTAKDGSYVLEVYPEQSYIVAVLDEPSRRPES